jgi:outer membrane protein TolC
VRQNLFRDTADAYYQVLGGTADVSVLLDLTATYEQRVSDLQRRVELGKSRDSELIQAQSAAAQARVAVERSKGLLGASRELLAFIVGVPADEWELVDCAPDLPTAGRLDAYLAQTAGRPDILAAMEAERAARKRLSAAKGERLPTAHFEWNYYFHDSDNLQEGEWNGLITVELPLFDGGSIEARVNENKALFARRKLDLSLLRREAERGARTAFNNFNARLAEYARLMEAQATAELNYRAQLADYDLGVVNNLDVLDALERFHALRREVAAARYQAYRDLADLTAAAGTAEP